jgi:hypothetical protein
MEAVEFGALARDGIIEIPAKYRKDYSTQVRVILLRNNRNEESDGYSTASIREKVAAAKRLVGIASENPMTLEEIKSERLSRQ